MSRRAREKEDKCAVAPADREQFVRDNAVSLLAERDARIKRQRVVLKQLNGSRGEVRRQLKRALAECVCFRAETADLKAQRDELLAALRRILAHECSLTPCMWCAEQAKAAIARVQGKGGAW